MTGGLTETMVWMLKKNTNPDGYPYNVGWTEVGEWLGYTVENVTPGTYNINVSVASNGVAGMFFIQINGVNVSVVNVPASTGGWYNWVDLNIPDVEISGGQSAGDTMRSKAFS